MQYNDTHLSFLREKIMDTKVALFKSEINSELSLPTNIIQTINTDDEGNIYFFTACNGNYAKHIDVPFYAYLDYHKKGFENRLRISGKAVIVNEGNGEVLAVENLNGASAKSIVLIKMKMMQAEFFGQTSHQNQSWPQKLKSTINHLLFPAAQHNYKFE